MTRQQLRRLEVRLYGACRSEEESNLVVRLFDEREQLLEALRWYMDGKTPYDSREIRPRFLEALTFAEGDAK